MGKLVVASLASSFLCVFLSLSLLHRTVNGGYVKYNTSGGVVEGKLNVHLVPHSHDDVGWLKTIDQYYVGSNNSIQVILISCINVYVYMCCLCEFGSYGYRFLRWCCVIFGFGGCRGRVWRMFWTQLWNRCYVIQTGSLCLRRW